MHAYLLLGGTTDEQNKKLTTLYIRHKVRQSSRFLIDVADGKQSIGIEEIKNLTASLWIQSTNNTPKAAVIRNSHKLTTEAQNALLKNLEEPPGLTVFFLLSPSEQMLLDTIVSRCIIIPVDTEQQRQDVLQDDPFTASLCDPSITIGTCIKEMETRIQTKDDALSWFASISRSLPVHIQTHPENHVYILVARLFPLIQTAFDRNVSWKTVLTTLIIRTKSHPLDKPEENCVQ